MRIQSPEKWLERVGSPTSTKHARRFDDVRRLAINLGLQHVADRVAVVGGTNGKGSVVFKTEQLLLQQGVRVGATVSPHLHTVNERIRVDGTPVRDEEIIHALDQVWAAKGDARLSYFDVVTLAALHLFKEANLDVALLEVGLGGRLDTTNVTSPDVSVLVNIGLDHIDRLGRDVEAIGAEKAAILRRGKPAIFGERRMPNSVYSHARTLHAKVLCRDVDFGVLNGRTLFGTRHSTRHFLEVDDACRNGAIAWQLSLVLGLEGSRNDKRANAAIGRNLPGRMERVSYNNKRWWLDVAHNQDGIRYTTERIQQRHPHARLCCLFGCLADKDVGAMLNHLASSCSNVVVTSTFGRRGLSCRQVRETVEAQPSVRFCHHVRHAVATVNRLAQPGDVVLACGSFDVVARVRRLLMQSSDSST